MKRLLIILLVLSLPTFALMLKFGIFTMHDFHVFRQFEFSRCFADGVFPCRWSPDSGLGYGEPLFVFYGQFPYWLGQIFRTLAFSIIDSVKAVFILSLVGSGLTMFVLARRFWGNLGGLVSAVFYMYAPYRSVDVWVRGALPEALSFVFFPLLFYFLDRYLLLKKTKYLLFLSLTFALLIINHNLSTYMITPFLGFFWLFYAVRSRSWFSALPLIGAGLLSGLLAAFYLLPVLFENSLTTVTQTTQGYYNFQLHYATLHQVFISRFWGYGGSVWGPTDGLSFSVGQLHWILPLLIAAGLVIFRKLRHPGTPLFFFCLAMGFFALFLTHGKSEFIWKLIPGMAFVQFPWRFLSPAVFFLSLAVGILPTMITAYRSLVSALSVVAVVLVNFSFYHPDIWRPIGDNQQFQGSLWNEQRSSALLDYWPKTAPVLPVHFASVDPVFASGSGQSLLSRPHSQSADYSLEIASPQAQVTFPIVYFPGWVGEIDRRPVYVGPDPAGLISLPLSRGLHQVSLKFIDTPVRYWGNVISLAALVFWLLGLTACLIYDQK